MRRVTADPRQRAERMDSERQARAARKRTQSEISRNAEEGFELASAHIPFYDLYGGRGKKDEPPPDTLVREQGEELLLTDSQLRSVVECANSHPETCMIQGHHTYVWASHTMERILPNPQDPAMAASTLHCWMPLASFYKNTADTGRIDFGRAVQKAIHSVTGGPRPPRPIRKDGPHAAKMAWLRVGLDGLLKVACYDRNRPESYYH